MDIPLRFKFRLSLFFALFQDLSTALQYITRTEKKEQQITNEYHERLNLRSDQSAELHVMEKKKSYLQFYVKKQ